MCNWFKLIFSGVCCAAIMLTISCEGDSDDPTPTPTPTPTNAIAGDEIAVSNIVWLDTDVSKWEITSKLDVSLSGSLIVYDQDGTTKWPATYVDGGYVSGNPWVFVYKNGEWYGATHEWMRPRQTRKNKSSVSGSHIKEYNHFSSSWVPTPGVKYGFMVSGLARTSARNAEERTQIMLMTWK